MDRNYSNIEIDDYDFILGLSTQLSSNQLDTILLLLSKKGFKHLLVNDKKLSNHYLLFLRHDNPKIFLKEAEKHNFLKKVYQSRRNSESTSPLKSKLKSLLIQKGNESLDPRVRELETFRRFTFAQRRQFLNQTVELAQTSSAKKVERFLTNETFDEKEENGSTGRQPFPSLECITKVGSLQFIVSRDDEIQMSLEMVKQESPDNNDIFVETRATLTTQLTQNTDWGESLKMSRRDKGRSQSKLSPSQKVKSMNKLENYEEYLKIFTPSEICRVGWSLLNSIEADLDDTGFCETFRITKIKDDFESHHLMTLLKNLKLLKYARPLHKKGVEQSLKNNESIKDYFGPKVAIYFEFLLFYTKWLIVPAVCGIVNQYKIFENSPRTQFWMDTTYCLLTMIWGALFVRFWERKTNEFKVRWGSYGAQFKISTTRSNFKGDLRVNPITELPELYNSPSRKLLRIFFSVLAHLPLFLLSFLTAVVYLNIKGNVIPGHWIYIEPLSILALPGGLFKQSRNKILIKIIRVAIKLILRSLNNALSKITTDWENRRTHTSYENSMTVKRFLFGIINTFTNLTYIAFWRNDLDALREEILILYITDEAKRFLSESLGPLLHKKFAAKKFDRPPRIIEGSLTKELQNEQLKVAQSALDDYIVEKVNEIKGKELNTFKDYYDMVIQFGYISLFAVAFPLSGMISLVLNFIEFKSSLFKLRSVFRRSVPEAVNGIGSWLGAIKTISYLSIITNSILIANGADYRKTLTAELTTEGRNLEGQEGKTLGVIFLVEHIMLILLFSMRKLIQKYPIWVRVYIKRNLEKGGGLWVQTN